eukprot:NODE_24329_length_629_cov_4.245020.p2 GENE.NODE_24329_length_629_cov_4.245020~~NODE_24329_length_629_cov_4.245020.p2  ORF type:complete len:83 (-),score=3.28 NODE_24329_length_629_cov_4.245020:45-293(-)
MTSSLAHMLRIPRVLHLGISGVQLDDVDAGICQLKLARFFRLSSVAPGLPFAQARGLANCPHIPGHPRWETVWTMQGAQTLS